MAYEWRPMKIGPTAAHWDFCCRNVYRIAGTPTTLEVWKTRSGRKYGKSESGQWFKLAAAWPH